MTSHTYWHTPVHPAPVAVITPGRRTNHGFSLIEIAVALFIVTLILGSILVPLATQVEQKQLGDTEKTMTEIKDALVGFAAANSYLPCPDTTGDGIADPNAPGACPNAEGFVPWVTLNVPQGDSWGNRFRYRVTPEFTNTPASGACSTSDGRLGLCDSGNITINNRNSTTKATQILVSNAAAIIISHGRNGYGATSTDGIARVTPPGFNVDETTNADPPGTTFMSRSATSVSTTCSDTAAGQPFCEFDDVVTWVSAFTIFNRMVAAGRLP